jgi:hypothetical protein
VWWLGSLREANWAGYHVQCSLGQQTHPETFARNATRCGQQANGLTSRCVQPCSLYLCVEDEQLYPCTAGCTTQNVGGTKPALGGTSMGQHGVSTKRSPVARAAPQPKGGLNVETSGQDA